MSRKEQQSSVVYIMTTLYAGVELTPDQHNDLVEKAWDLVKFWETKLLDAD